MSPRRAFYECPIWANLSRSEVELLENMPIPAVLQRHWLRALLQVLHLPLLP